MTNDTRTPDDIERAIRDERAQMSHTINNLQRKFSVDAIAGDLGRMFRGQGGDLGRALGDRLGRNPVAVVMVGVGLAWLVLGQDRKGPADAARHPGSNRPASGLRPDILSWSGAGQASRGHDAPNGVLGVVQGAVSDLGGMAQDTAEGLGKTASDLSDRLSHGLEDLIGRAAGDIDHQDPDRPRG